MFAPLGLVKRAQWRSSLQEANCAWLIPAERNVL